MPYAKINNAKLYYEIDGSGEPLLLIHGVRGSIRNWQYVRPHIRQHFQTIFPELRGHGRSSELTEVTKVEQFAQDLLQLLELLKIKKCIVAGYSLGGFIAQQMVLDAPESVKKLILICTAPIVDVEAAQAQIQIGQLVYGLSSEEAVEKLLGFAFYDPKKVKEIPGMVEHLLLDHREGQRLANSHGYAQGAAVSFDIQDRVSEIRVPTLVILGAQDETFPVKWGNYYSEKLSDVKVEIIDKTNHAIIFEQPEALVKVIVDFAK